MWHSGFSACSTTQVGASVVSVKRAYQPGCFKPLTLCAVYVIMIAGANDISSGAVGLVYFCAVFPALLVKLTAPYW